MSLCLDTAGQTLALALQAFTLVWTHSVERTEWRENWVIDAGQLVIVEASVEGSGAGMEIPDGAILRDGAWHYRPAIPAQAQVTFADAGRDGSDWTICDGADCAKLRTLLPIRGEGFAMQACDAPGISLSQAESRF